MPKGIKCAKCGHTSVVRSNFRGLSDGRFYCNSVKRPNCENERQAELKLKEFNDGKGYSFAPMEGWR